MKSSLWLDAMNIEDRIDGMEDPDEVTYDQLLRRVSDLCSGLYEAARSLETISRAGGRDSELRDLIDVRGYAANRARVARQTLEGTTRIEEKR